MIDEWKQLQHQLQRATAADPPPNDLPLDPETASLREGWMLLGQLLGEAQPEPKEPLEFAVPRRHERSQRGRAIAALLAASLLIGATLVGSMMETSRTEKTATPGTERPADVQEAVASGLDTLDLAWEDDLDQRIARVGEQLILVQQDRYSLDDVMASVAYGIEQIGREFEDDTF